MYLSQSDKVRLQALLDSLLAGTEFDQAWRACGYRNEKRALQALAELHIRDPRKVGRSLPPEERAQATRERLQAMRRCARCTIYLTEAPPGRDDLCGWCIEELEGTRRQPRIEDMATPADPVCTVVDHIAVFRQAQLGRRVLPENEGPMIAMEL